MLHFCRTGFGSAYGTTCFRSVFLSMVYATSNALINGFTLILGNDRHQQITESPIRKFFKLDNALLSVV